jgi:hypothetical protein
VKENGRKRSLNYAQKEKAKGKEQAASMRGSCGYK